MIKLPIVIEDPFRSATRAVHSPFMNDDGCVNSVAFAPYQNIWFMLPESVRPVVHGLWQAVSEEVGRNI